MPKVKSYSAAWLSKGSQGHRLFEPSADSSQSRGLTAGVSSKKKQLLGPRRTIAKRGSEVFVAVGKEIRWADLVAQKDNYASRPQGGRSGQTPRVKREESAMSITIEEDEPAAGVRVCSSTTASCRASN